MTSQGTEAATPDDRSPPLPINPLDHVGLVVSVAKRYRNRGVDMEDMIQEGYMGLIVACREYKPMSQAPGGPTARGLSFASFAKVMIARSVRAAVLGRHGPIDIPYPVFRLVIKFRKGQLALDGLSPATRSRVEDALVVLGRGCGSGDETRWIVDDRGFASTGDGDPERGLSMGPLGPLLTSCLDTLSDRHREIVASYHGLMGKRETFDEIGDRLGISRENARGQYKRAVGRIRQRSGTVRTTRTERPSRVKYGLKSPYRGVYLRENGRFAAKFRVGGSLRHFGTYDTQEEAKKVVNDRGWELLGIEGFAIESKLGV